MSVHTSLITEEFILFTVGVDHSPVDFANLTVGSVLTSKYFVSITEHFVFLTESFALFTGASF
jgi:hypothetical protein